MSEVSDFWAEGEDDPGLPVVRLTAPIDLRQFDYRTLFRLVAQHDLGVTPALGARVYLIDETDPMLFCMYDDRGAIVHAPTPERLRSLQEHARDWLVE